MSGVLGIWHRDGRPVEHDVLAAANASLGHRGPDGACLWVDGSIGLASQLHRVTPESTIEAQPARAPSGLTVVFDGRLDNRDELLAVTGAAPSLPDPNLVMAVYEKLGDSCVARLNGDFAFGLFDPARQQLMLARDAIGARPLYYAESGGTMVFASEVKGILATGIVAAEPNLDLFADFLLRRTQLHADRGETFFDGVRSVPPGHTLVATRERVLIERYWSFDLGRRLTHPTFAEYAEEFGHLFRQAVRRRLRSRHPVGVAVSGGLDSSAIFCVAHREAPSSVVGVSSIGVPGSPTDESAFVQAIERDHGVTIERFDGPATGMMAGVHDAARQLEMPLLDMQWSRTRQFRSTVRSRGAHTMLTGHWGDQVLFDQSYLTDLVRRREWRTAWRHLNEYGRWFTDSPARDFYRVAAADLIRQFVPGGRGLVRTVRRALGAGGDPVWYTPALTARVTPSSPDPAWHDPAFPAHGRAIAREATNKFHTLYLEWSNKAAASAGLDIAFPFLDRDLVAFLVAVPGEVASHDGVPKALLRHACRDVLPAEIAARRWKADFTTLVNRGAKDDLATVARLMNGGSLAVRRGLVSREVVVREVGRAGRALAGDTGEFGWAVRDLVGLEWWLRSFCGLTVGG